MNQNSDIYDVCLIGAGIITIYLAEIFAKNNLSVLILEKGSGRNFFKSLRINKESSKSDRKNIEHFGNVLEVNQWEGDRHFLNILRFSMIGGSANFWGGESLILTEAEYKDAFNWNPQYCNYEKYIGSVKKIFTYLAVDSYPKTISEIDSITLDEFHYTSSFKVSKRYKQALEKYKNLITVKSNHYASKFDSKKVTCVTPDKNNIEYRFDNLIIANGGIESIRLLLNQHNPYPTLGSGYEEILHGHVGEVNAERGKDYTKFNNDFILHKKCIRGSIDFEDKSYSFVIRFEKVQYINRLIVAVRNIYRKVLFSYVFEKIKWRKVESRSGSINVWLCIQGDGYHDLNRVAIEKDVDMFGVRKIRISWKLFRDYKKMQREILCKVNRYILQEYGLVISEFSHEDSNSLGFLHGGAHMSGGLGSAKERKKVINENMALRHLPNVYLCSSALFSRAPAANLTLTTLTIADAISEAILRKKKTCK